MNKITVPFYKSISTTLFRRVFLLYLFIAILTTSLHMLIEFRNTKANINTELKTISKAIEPGITKALWDIHHEQLQSILEGTLSQPSIIAIKVENEYGEEVSFIMDKNLQYKATNQYSRYQIDKQIYELKTDLFYSDSEQLHKTGSLYLYSNHTVVWSRVRFGFILIVVNSLLKSLVLWALFILFAKRIITRPMSAIVDRIQLIKDQGLSIDQPKNISDYGSNEIELLKQTLDAMFDKMKRQQTSLENHSEQLEHTVEERTKELKDAYNSLEKIRDNELRILNSKRQFMSDISHELRTPLSVIKLQIESLEAGIDDIPSHCTKLNFRIDQIDHIIGDLAILAKIDNNELSFDFKPVDIGSLLKDMAASYEPLIESNQLSLEVSIDIDPSLRINADEQRLRQVISNILDNSIKYTAPPGLLCIEARTISDTVIINIKDTKPSVDINEIPNIFERLYRVENSRNRHTGGSGLGLSICKSFIEAHAGNISASISDLGGLSITISIPINREDDIQN